MRNTDFDITYETTPHPITQSALAALQRVLDDPTMDGASVLIRAATAALRYAPRIPAEPMPPDKETGYHDTIRDLLEQLGARSDPNNSARHAPAPRSLSDPIPVPRLDPQGRPCVPDQQHGSEPLPDATHNEPGASDESRAPSAQSHESAEPHPAPEEAHGQSARTGTPFSPDVESTPRPP